MASTIISSSSVPETVFEGLEFSEANNILLMALMEETPEEEQDHDLYHADDDRLMSMIQSLEAEISSSNSHMQRHDDDDIDHHHVGQVDGQDFSTSSVCTTDDRMDLEVTSATSSTSSSPPFDEDIMMMSAWSPCAAGGDYGSDVYSGFSYGVLLDNYSYLPQETSDSVF